MPNQEKITIKVNGSDLRSIGHTAQEEIQGMVFYCSDAIDIQYKVVKEILEPLGFHVWKPIERQADDYVIKTNMSYAKFCMITGTKDEIVERLAREMAEQEGDFREINYSEFNYYGCVAFDEECIRIGTINTVHKDHDPELGIESAEIINELLIEAHGKMGDYK